MPARFRLHRHGPISGGPKPTTSITRFALAIDTISQIIEKELALLECVFQDSSVIYGTV